MKNLRMKNMAYYGQYSHFHKVDLNKVSSFKTIKDWLGSSKNAIDIGCGVGHLTAFLSITGIDNDINAICFAKKKYPKTKFILGDVTKNLPFKNRSLDAIICYNILEHLTEKGRESFFSEAKRILKKEGILIAGYIDENFWLNRILAIVLPDHAGGDSTHLVSWKLSDFENEITKNFKIIKKKKTNPYARLTFITKYLKGEEIILAKQL